MKSKIVSVLLVMVSLFLLATLTTTAIQHDARAAQSYVNNGEILWLNDGMAAEFERSQAALAKLPKGSPIVRQRPPRFQFVMEGQTYEIGFREDGVVVWKKGATR